jgi:hypothetical protein
MFWLGVTRVRPSQQDHQRYKGNSAPNWQGQGLDNIDITDNIRKAAFHKIKPALLSNYYSILSDKAPPPCQVKEQEISKQPESIHNVNKTKVLKQLIKKGVLNGSIPSIVADSAATSHIGTKHDPFIPMGRTPKKIFQLPNETRTAASTISELVHNFHQPAKDNHILPTIKTNSLLSTEKFAAAGYITVFDDKEVNIYNPQNTMLKVSRAAILRGWLDKKDKSVADPTRPHHPQQQHGNCTRQ